MFYYESFTVIVRTELLIIISPKLMSDEPDSSMSLSACLQSVHRERPRSSLYRLPQTVSGISSP